MSNKISLLPGEQVVTSSNNDVLVLTTKRVRYDFVVWGRSSLISMLLESVASCGRVTQSFPIILLFAGLAFFIALFQRGDQSVLFLGLSIMLVVAYFLARRAVISITANGGQAILVPAKDMKREAIIGFIDALEHEKLK